MNFHCIWRLFNGSDIMTVAVVSHSRCSILNAFLSLHIIEGEEKKILSQFLFSFLTFVISSTDFFFFGAAIILIMLLCKWSTQRDTTLISLSKQIHICTRVGGCIVLKLVLSDFHSCTISNLICKRFSSVASFLLLHFFFRFHFIFFFCHSFTRSFPIFFSHRRYCLCSTLESTIIFFYSFYSSVVIHCYSADE